MNPIIVFEADVVKTATKITTWAFSVSKSSTRLSRNGISDLYTPEAERAVL